MIAETLPGQRRDIQPRRPIKDPVGVNDVTQLLHAMSGQLADVAEHFLEVGRDRESMALTRVALEINAKALHFAVTGKLTTTKSMASIVTGLRSAGVIERKTLLAMRKVLAGKNPTHEDMTRLAGLVRCPLVD